MPVIEGPRIPDDPELRSNFLQERVIQTCVSITANAEAKAADQLGAAELLAKITGMLGKSDPGPKRRDAPELGESMKNLGDLVSKAFASKPATQQTKLGGSDVRVQPSSEGSEGYPGDREGEVDPFGF